MDEKIKYENIKKAAEEVFKSTVVIGQGELNLWIETIRAITGKDVVEVVRCKNCANSRPLNQKDPFENIYCDECVWCSLRKDGVFEDHFCRDGKRKDGAE